MNRIGEDTPDPFVGFLIDAPTLQICVNNFDIIVMSGRNESAERY